MTQPRGKYHTSPGPECIGLRSLWAQYGGATTARHDVTQLGGSRVPTKFAQATGLYTAYKLVCGAFDIDAARGKRNLATNGSSSRRATFGGENFLSAGGAASFGR
jgi:hypothetical protein